MAKVFPNAPISIKWYILTISLVFSTLYIDYTTSGYTNPIVFFISTVAFPLTVAAIVNRIEGYDYIEMLGFIGDPLYAVSMFLISAGIVSMLFFLFVSPMLDILRGTPAFSALAFMNLPLSSHVFWFTIISPSFFFVYYMVIAVGEEILKVFGWKNVANWLYDKLYWRFGFAFARNIIIIIGLLISFLGWMTCHIFSWGSLPPLGIIVGITYSILFMMPYYLFGEKLISPEEGILLNKFSIWAPIGGHFMYDFLLQLKLDGVLMGVDVLGGFLISLTLTMVGGTILLYEYIKKGYVPFSVFQP